MISTEMEAHELFCPHAFPLIGMNQQGERIFTCKGSGCMCWRWFNASSAGNNRKGYCGLSGRPDSSDT